MKAGFQSVLLLAGRFSICVAIGWQVFVGGVSDGQLQRGDVVIGIEGGTLTTCTTHRPRSSSRGRGDSCHLTCGGRYIHQGGGATAITQPAEVGRQRTREGFRLIKFMLFVAFLNFVDKELSMDTGKLWVFICDRHLHRLSPSY